MRLRYLSMFVIVLAGLALVFPAQSSGSLISTDSVYGPGTLTMDTATFFGWLDVTVTQGRSYNDISSKFGAGQEFEGFRYATLGEVAQFFTNAGIPNLNGLTAANFAPVRALELLVGITATGGITYNEQSVGVCGTSFSAGSHVIPSLRWEPGTGKAAGYTTTAGSQSDPSGNNNRGHWLILDGVVPVEATTWGAIKSLYR